MKVFDLAGKGTNFVAEILAGMTTFFTMSYVLVQCPAMLASENLAESSAYIAVCLACFIGCLLMGFIVNQPFVLGPSIGMTIFVSSTLLTELHYTYPQALVIILLSGLIFLLLSVSGMVSSIYGAIPKGLKSGVSAGIGLYLILLAFKNAGFLSGGENGLLSLINFSERNLQLFTVGVMFLGVILIGLFKKFHFPAHILLALLASGGIYYLVGILVLKFFGIDSIIPHLGSIDGQQFTQWASDALFKNLYEGVISLFFSGNVRWQTLLVIFITVILCALFNTVESESVIYVISRDAGKLDENGNFGELKKTMLFNSISTMTGSLVGSPMLSIAPESGAGIAAGGKTGLTAVTAGVFFLLAALFAPLTGLIPAAVTSCVLLYIGIMMLGAAKDIDFGEIGESVPAVITMLLIPFTSSVIDGIALGLIAHIIINLFIFRFKSVKIFELALGILFGICYFVI